MAKADIIEIVARKNGHTISCLVSIGESESKLKLFVSTIAPKLFQELGPQYIANFKTIAKSVEVPDSWAPYKIIKKEVKKLFE